MPLPSLESITPQFELTIPSTQKLVRFRTFLVKEEKLLYIALESDDEKSMLEAIIQVVNNCALEPIKAEILPNFDLEYIFLQLRAQSVNNMIELSYRCRNELDPNNKETICGNIIKLQLNVNDIQVHFNLDHKKQIFFTDFLGVNMRYPNAKIAKQIMAKKDPDTISDSIRTICLCVESIFDAENVYTSFTPTEIQDWIERLTQTQFFKLQEFFETMPKLMHDVPFLCSKCGYKDTIHLEGLPDFFG